MSRRIFTAADLAVLHESMVRGVPERSPLDEGPIAGRQPASTATTAPAGATDVPRSPDPYTSRLLKLIPADAVAVFLTIDAIIQTNHLVAPSVYWTITVVMTLLTYVYVLRVGMEPALAPPHRQALLAAFAFAVWVFTIGGPFAYAEVHWWSKMDGAVLLPICTFITPLLVPTTAAPQRAS